VDCIFCRIAGGELQSDILYQDDKVVAFPDVSPRAPVHILVIPRAHIDSVADLTEADASLMGHMVLVANRLAREAGTADKGYRLTVNCGSGGGQVAPHLHLHLLGGRQMGNMG